MTTNYTGRSRICVVKWKTEMETLSTVPPDQCRVAWRNHTISRQRSVAIKRSTPETGWISKAKGLISDAAIADHTTVAKRYVATNSFQVFRTGVATTPSVAGQTCTIAGSMNADILHGRGIHCSHSINLDCATLGIYNTIGLTKTVNAMVKNIFRKANV